MIIKLVQLYTISVVISACFGPISNIGKNFITQNVFIDTLHNRFSNKIYSNVQGYCFYQYHCVL